MKPAFQLLFFKSEALKCSIQADLIMPGNYDKDIKYPLLILNDGQDMKTIQVRHILEHVWKRKISKPFILIAPHSKIRMQEYGVENIPDFNNRGSLASGYSEFVTEELLPQLKRKLGIKSFEEIVIAGFSLGGLSAFDIAWNHAGIFSKAGVCSGSFWWRKKDLTQGYTDADRIMHHVVKNTTTKPGIKIWFQCGTLDETDDRNHNGIIDSIDDTLDLIADLESKGFVQGKDVFYNELIAGRHTLETYGIVLPYFLKWAFGA